MRAIRHVYESHSRKYHSKWYNYARLRKPQIKLKKTIFGGRTQPGGEDFFVSSPTAISPPGPFSCVVIIRGCSQLVPNTETEADIHVTWQHLIWNYILFINRNPPFCREERDFHEEKFNWGGFGGSEGWKERFYEDRDICSVRSNQ